MAEPFGRGRSRSSRRIRFQCGGSCTSNKSRLLTKTKVVKNHQQQLPTINQKCFSLKAGTAKTQHLSLDPQRNHPHCHPHQYPVVLNSGNVKEKQEGEEEAIAEKDSTKQNCNLQDVPPSHLQQDQHFCPRLGLDTQLQQPLKRRSYFPSSSSPNFGQESIQYARKMGESHNQAATSSRLGIRNAGGEIVEVQGGHIVRSTGRKDRHSKVCTAKGPRDRRVRLSAHTAIQFYDVQDRLGYDRPSKAVDWLIKKAKAAIDELAELPPWNPETVTNTAATTKGRAAQQNETNEDRNYQFPRTPATIVGSSNEVQNLQIVETRNQSSSFLPPSLDSDSIADTIKSFFPMGASTDTPSSSINFQSYPPDLLSRTTSHSQDLRLSLKSSQERNYILLQHQTHHHAYSQVQQQQQQQQHQNEQVQVLFSGANPLGYDNASAAWSESEHQHHHSAEIARFQRMIAWNSGAADTSVSASGSAGGYAFNSQPPPPLQQLFGQNRLFNSQRGPLQSSNTPSVRAWIDQPISLTNEYHRHHHHHHQILPPAIHQSVISSVGFASPVGEFSGFRIPARIQGEYEEHDGIHNRPSSASSDSRH